MRETGGMGGGGGPTFNPIFLLGTFKGLVLGGGALPHNIKSQIYMEIFAEIQG